MPFVQDCFQKKKKQLEKDNIHMVIKRLMTLVAKAAKVQKMPRSDCLQDGAASRMRRKTRMNPPLTFQITESFGLSKQRKNESWDELK